MLSPQGYPEKHFVPRMAQMNKPCFHAIKNHAVKPDGVKPSLIFATQPGCSCVISERSSGGQSPWFPVLRILRQSLSAWFEALRVPRVACQARPRQADAVSGGPCPRSEVAALSGGGPGFSRLSGRGAVGARHRRAMQHGTRRMLSPTCCGEPASLVEREAQGLPQRMKRWSRGYVCRAFTCSVAPVTANMWDELLQNACNPNGKALQWQRH